MSIKKTSVLIVDDSAFIRKAMKRMLGSDPMIRVIGEARDGIEALEKVRTLKPDVVTLDVKMPDMGGLEALEQIMPENPVPVLMVSSLTSEGGEITLRAFKLAQTPQNDQRYTDKTGTFLGERGRYMPIYFAISGKKMKRFF